MEIGLAGAEMFQADRSTDMKELIVSFRNFANAPKNELGYTSTSWRRHGQVYLLHELHYLNTTSHLHVYQVIPSFMISDGSSVRVCPSRPLQCLLPRPAVFLLLRLIFHDWHKLLENLSVNRTIIIEMELELVWFSGYALHAAASR